MQFTPAWPQPPNQPGSAWALRRAIGSTKAGIHTLYGLSFTAGVALGPAAGGILLATSPDAVWWGGALAAALTGAGLLRLGNRIPDPLVPAPRPAPRITRREPTRGRGAAPSDKAAPGSLTVGDEMP